MPLAQVQNAQAATDVMAKIALSQPNFCLAGDGCRQRQRMLDINIGIYLNKNHPPQVFRRLEALNWGDAVMSVATYAESINRIGNGDVNPAIDISFCVASATFQPHSVSISKAS